MTVDYGIIANPMQGFMQGLKFGTVLDEQQKAAQQAQAQQARAQQVQSAIQSLSTDRSPDNVANVLLHFPELKEQITASQGVLNDEQKRTDLDFSTRMLTLANAGRNDLLQQQMEQRAVALDNTQGKELEAKAVRDLAAAWKLDPELAKHTLAVKVASIDPDLYKTIYGSTDTSTAPEREYNWRVKQFGPEAANTWLAIQDDKLVPVEAGGKVYRASDLIRGGAQPMAPPAAGSVVNGFKFKGGDPKDKANWVPDKGGPSQSATGGFR